MIDFKDPKIQEILKLIPEYQENHKRLWTWVSRKPSRASSSWPHWNHNVGNIGHVRFNCFACSIANKLLEQDKVFSLRLECDYCPLDFGLGKTCISPSTVFDKLIKARNKLDGKAVRKYGLAISEMSFSIDEALVKSRVMHNAQQSGEY